MSARRYWRIPSEWEVTDIRGSDKMGWYFTTNIPSPAGEVVRVKLSKHGRHLCFTCIKSDDCVHATFVSRYIDSHGMPEEKK